MQRQSRGRPGRFYQSDNKAQKHLGGGGSIGMYSPRKFFTALQVSYDYGHWQARDLLFNARRRVSEVAIIVLCYFTFTNLCTQMTDTFVE